MRLSRIIKLNMSGNDVCLLQTMLKEHKFFNEKIDSNFGQNTLLAVVNFQRSVGVKADGIVGTLTWSKLNEYGKVEESKDIKHAVSHIGNNGLKIYDCLLDDSEYIKEETKKDTIWLHGSSGGSRPDWTIGGWRKDFIKDKKGNPILDQSGNIQHLKIANSYVIGRKSSTDVDSTWDGKVLRSFNDKYWAYHLDIQSDDSYSMNSKSIGIEFCNYGPLTIGKDGRFYNSINKPISEEDVVKLDTQFRGYDYFEKYTDLQLSNARNLITYLINKYDIKLDGKIYNESWFGQNIFKKGIKSYSQIKKDDLGVFPQKEMIQMLNSL